MQMPGGSRTLFTVAEVLAGSAGAALLSKQVAGGQIFGQPAELVAGAALLAAGLFAGPAYGKDLMALAAGALAAPVTAKVLQVTGPKIAGVPYYVGQLPEGATLQIPRGAQQTAYQNLAGVAGIV